MIDIWFEFFFLFFFLNQFWLISAFFKHNSLLPNFLTNSHAWKISHHIVPDWITSLTHFKLVRVGVFWPQRPTKLFFKYKWHELYVIIWHYAGFLFTFSGLLAIKLWYVVYVALLHFRTPPLLLMTHHEKTRLKALP